MKWDGIWCPCGNHRLRLAPRNGKYKEKYLHTIAKRKGKSKIRI
jgi:hypothetical protein